MDKEKFKKMVWAYGWACEEYGRLPSLDTAVDVREFEDKLVAEIEKIFEKTP